MSSLNGILVTGATGVQGGSVARHLLSRGRYRVRCLTRNPTSEKAQALRKAGAEIVKGDLGKVEDIRAALAGCEGVFGVTNYWEHFGREYEQGRNLIDAVAAAGVEHFVFSSKPHAREISKGELHVPSFDIKAELEGYARRRGLQASFIHVAFYFENFLTRFPLRPRGDGLFSFGFPQGDTPLAGVAADDIGGVVAAILDAPERFTGRTTRVVGDVLEPREYARVMTCVLGRTVTYDYIPRGVFASLGSSGADDLADVFEFNRLYVASRPSDLEESRSLFHPMQTFETWLEANKERFLECSPAR
jgi:uncharacterized protein YbjT (DUF2867 family)